MVKTTSICRNQNHPKFRPIWAVIKTPSRQTRQASLWKMRNKAPKQRQELCFLVPRRYSGCRFGVEGHVPAWTRGMGASTAGSKRPLLIYRSHTPDFQWSCYEIALKKRLFDQMTPHLTQLLHKGHQPATCTHTHLTPFIDIGMSLTCDDRIRLRSGNACSQICRSRAGYIGLHVV